MRCVRTLFRQRCDCFNFLGNDNFSRVRKILLLSILLLSCVFSSDGTEWIAPYLDISNICFLPAKWLLYRMGRYALPLPPPSPQWMDEWDFHLCNIVWMQQQWRLSLNCARGTGRGHFVIDFHTPLDDINSTVIKTKMPRLRPGGNQDDASTNRFDRILSEKRCAEQQEARPF